MKELFALEISFVLPGIRMAASYTNPLDIMELIFWLNGTITQS